MSGGCVVEKAVVEVCRSSVVEGLVAMFEGDSFVDRETVKVSQVTGDVAVAGNVQDKSGQGVLDSLQFLLKFLGGAGIECITVVELAADKRLSGCSPGLGGDPLENLPNQVARVEIGG
ncbi:hypothetical protein NDU88_002436 [Pleurodeles waltl]|uniref:Uncharacterized protein n=1 Tax=Pleurodeles waltl TaxID=8319 RepID=A0AAV7UAT9_PLEWA|nr:hypothetical protein NDU88_002436 [Pleurodeles waltl]